MDAPWLETLKSAEKTALTQDGKKKVHYTLKDGTELSEEYDIKTKELTVRKWRRRGTLGGHGPWEFEIGEAALPTATALDQQGILESAANPVLVRRDARDAFTWRIRNLPYPRDVYSVSVDPATKELVVRTTNKKYFKKIKLPDMERAGLDLMESAVTFAHANNTLIIQYKKPREVLQIELEVLKEVNKLKASEDGDVDCKPS